MTVASLKSLCQIRHGGTPSKANAAYWDGSIPWVSPKDMKSATLSDASDHISQEAVDNSATSVVPEKSILVVVRSGILAHSLPVAQAAKPLAFNQDIKALMPDAELVDPDYLFWFVRSQEPRVLAQGVKKGATVHSVQSGFIENLNVPVPDRAEQRRIVDLLSRAEGIVRLRREADKKAAELIPALFLDMFGDPATNPKGWPTATFGAFGECRLGKMLDKQKQNGDYQRPYLRNVNVQWDRIDTYDLLTMDFRPDEQSKFLVRLGDVLICEGGEIGRAAIWQGQIAECFYQKALHKLTPDLSIARPDFVVWLLWHLANTGALLGSSTHATIAHLTGVQLKGLNVICPPIELQTEFEKRVDSCHSIQSQQSTATAKAQATFDALLAQAFS